MIYYSERPCSWDISTGKICDRQKSPLFHGGEIEITKAEGGLASLSP